MLVGGDLLQPVDDGDALGGHGQLRRLVFGRQAGQNAQRVVERRPRQEALPLLVVGVEQRLLSGRRVLTQVGQRALHHAGLHEHVLELVAHAVGLDASGEGAQRLEQRRRLCRLAGVELVKVQRRLEVVDEQTHLLLGAERQEG